MTHAEKLKRIETLKESSDVIELDSLTVEVVAFERLAFPIDPPTMPASDLLGPLAYVPEIWRVKKDTIYAAIPAVESGLEYARECLAHHEAALGRTTRKNKTWAETMEKDIRHMERTLEMLRACPANTPTSGGIPSDRRA